MDDFSLLFPEIYSKNQKTQDITGAYNKVDPYCRKTGSEEFVTSRKLQNLFEDVIFPWL